MDIPYTGESIVKGNPLYKEIPYKGKSLVKENPLYKVKHIMKENIL